MIDPAVLRDHPDLVRSLILSEPGLGTVLADRPGGAEAIAEQHAGWTVVGQKTIRLLTVHVVDKGKPLYDWVRK